MSDLSIDDDPPTPPVTVTVAGSVPKPGFAKSTSNLVAQASKKAEENRRKFAKV